MKRLACILLCLLTIFSLVGCAPGGYLNSTDGDITVSLPDKQEATLPEFTEEQKLLLGKWELVSITQNGQTTTYTDSSYTFTEAGKCLAVVSGVNDDGSFSFTDGALYIWGKPVAYTIENDVLTITDADNKVHLLNKAVEQTQSE